MPRAPKAPARPSSTPINVSLSFAVGAIEGANQRNDVPPGNSATDESGSRRAAAHAPRIDVSQLTRTAPPHLASAGENSLTPNTRAHARRAGWGGREPGADGRLGRKRA